MERLGRKRTLKFCACVYVTVWLLLMCRANITMLFVGRLVTGAAVGMTTSAVAVYVSETTCKSYRGAFGTLFELESVCSILLVYVLGVFLPWRWLALVCAVLAVIWLILATQLPE